MRPDDVARRMAELAAGLASTDATSALQRFADLTVELLDGCLAVTVTEAVTEGGHTSLHPLAASGAPVGRADELQRELGEGPAYDAPWDQLYIAVDLEHDARWPAWSRATAKAVGARSALVTRLVVRGSTQGLIVFYSADADAFSGDRLDDALVLVTPGLIVLTASHHIDQLQSGLARRTAIGQATGILMERYGLASTPAFDVLRRQSQAKNRKLHELAAALADDRRPLDDL